MKARPSSGGSLAKPALVTSSVYCVLPYQRSVQLKTPVFVQLWASLPQSQSTTLKHTFHTCYDVLHLFKDVFQFLKFCGSIFKR